MKAILIVKIGAIGDVAMCLPMLLQISEKYPQAKITWVCGATVSPLIAATQRVHKIISVDETALLKGPRRAQIKALFSLWRQLFACRFDLVLTAHPDPRYRWISRWCRSPERRFLNRKGLRMFPVAGRYHAEEYSRLFTQEEGARPFQTTFPQLLIPPSPQLTRHLSPLEGRSFIVLAPGGAKNVLADNAMRRWPIDFYLDVMKQLDQEGFGLVVTGGTTDTWVRPFLQGVPHRDLIGSLTVLELIDLLKQAKLFITHDSGPMHLAKLAACPTIALFGPTNPAEFVGKEKNMRVLWGGEHLACRPCYDGKTYANCSHNECLRAIRPEHVFKAALELLSCNLL